MVLRDSRLQQSKSLAQIPFKCQLSDLGCKDHKRGSLDVHVAQQFCRFFQITLSLINAGLICHHIRIAGQDVERSIKQLQRVLEFPKIGEIGGRFDEQIRVTRIQYESLLKIGGGFIPLALPLSNPGKSKGTSLLPGNILPTCR